MQAWKEAEGFHLTQALREAVLQGQTRNPGQIDSQRQAMGVACE